MLQGMDRERRKPPLDTMVLAALAAGPAHGYAIIEDIKRSSGERFALPEGTLYPTLHRLEQAGLLSSRWVPAPAARRRRVYALTKPGKRALIEHGPAWQGIASVIAVIDGLLGPASARRKRA